MEAFETPGLGARTIVHAFGCNGGEGMRHAICKLCDRRMFKAHRDACPICRAPRLGSSISQLGWRPPLERESPFIAPTLTSGGTIFFPIEEDDVSIPTVTIVHRTDASSGETTQSSSSSIINDVLSDPVFRAALEGLRNPGRVSVTTFLSNVGEARRVRGASAQQVASAVHDAHTLAESYGYM